jgi:Flp pilus assembly pilin Flp
MKAKNGTHLNSEQGQGLIEYTLIVLLLAIVMIAGLNVLGSGILSSMYNVVLASIP